MVRVILFAMLDVVDAAGVVCERIEGRIDGHRNGSQSCHGLHHLLLVSRRNVDESETRCTNVLRLVPARAVLLFVRVFVLTVYSLVFLN